MNIPFDKIIEKKILLPLHNYPASKFQFDIEDIVIFEYNDIPLAKQSLVFFSRNYSSVITLELLTHLSALSCAVVFHLLAVIVENSVSINCCSSLIPHYNGQTCFLF